MLGYAFDRGREYGLAGFDRTHTLTIDYVYELPRFAKDNEFAKALFNDWQISGITRLWSGRPFTLMSNANPGTLGSGVRPDYVGGMLSWMTRAFTTTSTSPRSRDRGEGQLGNVGRNTLRGPGINNWDISLFKNTRISEKVNIQLRFETFNVFNHTQWDTSIRRSMLPIRAQCSQKQLAAMQVPSPRLAIRAIFK